MNDRPTDSKLLRQNRDTKLEGLLAEQHEDIAETLRIVVEIELQRLKVH